MCLDASSLSNISVKQVLTPNLLTGDDSTFDTDTGNWNKGAGISITSGVLRFTSATSGTSAYSGDIEATSKRWYLVRLYVAAYTAGSARVRVNSTSALTDLNVNSTGWYSTFVQAESVSTRGLDIIATGTTTMDIDNVIVQEVPASVARAFYLDFDGAADNLILDADTIAASSNATLYKTLSLIHISEPTRPY